jgi:hypothetical protein
MVHLVGRISWYMNLTQLILSPSWHDADDFAARREDFARHGAENRDAISRLYRRVLEFEMNCVCAAASAWNNRAKQVVCWKRVGRLVEDLRAADEKVHALVQANIKEARLRDDLLACDADLDLDEIERLDRETGDRWDDVNEDKASANQEPPDWNYKPVTIMA